MKLFNTIIINWELHWIEDKPVRYKAIFNGGGGWGYTVLSWTTIHGGVIGPVNLITQTIFSYFAQQLVLIYYRYIILIIH